MNVTNDYRISLTDLGFAIKSDVSNWTTRVHDVWSDYDGHHAGVRATYTSRLNHAAYGSAKPSSGGAALVKQSSGWNSSEATAPVNSWAVYADGGEAYLKVRMNVYGGFTSLSLIHI